MIRTAIQLPLRPLRQSSSTLWIRRLSIPGSNAVKQIQVKDFKALLESKERDNYQIIDVRESDELVASQIKTHNIIHMPMTESYRWTFSYYEKKGLDEKKPTIVYCKHGVRSMQVASYLG
jgi:rhodanese-related sulfurtransferase